MAKHLVLAGGGHAHMMLLADINTIVSQGHKVTVVQPSDYHYYSGMGPGMLSTTYSADDIRFHTRYVVERQGGTFIKAKVTGIKAEEKMIQIDSGENINYDILSCNVGSSVPFSRIEGRQDTVFSAKPIERLLDAQQKILALCHRGKISIGVVGGGPAAIEIAGNALHLTRTTGCGNAQVRIFAGKRIMKDFSSPIQNIVRKSFSRKGIVIDESGYVARIADGVIHLEKGGSFAPDIIFLATGVKPSSIFASSSLKTGPDGGLPVNEYLQSSEFESIFGGGDCIYFASRPLEKVGVYAVRENPVLLHNVVAALNGDALHKFDPGGNYLLIFNLGNGMGALQKGLFTWGGKMAFIIKDHIDRKFMRTFQALET